MGTTEGLTVALAGPVRARKAAPLISPSPFPILFLLSLLITNYPGWGAEEPAAPPPLPLLTSLAVVSAGSTGTGSSDRDLPPLGAQGWRGCPPVCPPVCGAAAVPGHALVLLQPVPLCLSPPVRHRRCASPGGWAAQPEAAVCPHRLGQLRTALSQGDALSPSSLPAVRAVQPGIWPGCLHPSTAMFSWDELPSRGVLLSPRPHSHPAWQCCCG